jgi:hypothetical protein
LNITAAAITFLTQAIADLALPEKPAPFEKTFPIFAEVGEKMWTTTNGSLFTRGFALTAALLSKPHTAQRFTAVKNAVYLLRIAENTTGEKQNLCDKTLQFFRIYP